MAANRHISWYNSHFLRFLYFGCELFTCDLKNNFKKSQIFLHWTLCEIPQSSLIFCRTSKSPNTQITSKSVQIHPECETSGRFLRFMHFGYEFFICDFMKILQKSRIFSLRNLCEIPHSTFKFFQHVKKSKTPISCINDRNTLQMASKRRISMDFIIWLWIIHFGIHENFKKPTFHAWNGQNALKL